MDIQFHFCRPEIKEIFHSGNSAKNSGKTAVTPSHVECHQEREILIPIEGAATFFFDRNLFSARHGTAFLIDSWISHSVISQPEQGNAMQLWIHLHDTKIFASLVKVTSSQADQAEWTSSAELPQELLSLLSRRWDLLRNPLLPCELADKIRHSIIETILDELEFLETGPVNKNGARIKPVQFIKRYIESTRGRGCTIAGFEKIIGFNRCYLARIFKAQTGVSITNFIHQVRFGHYAVACARGFTQKEIAEQLGFSCLSAFSRWKKNFRETRQKQESYPPVTGEKSAVDSPKRGHHR